MTQPLATVPIPISVASSAFLQSDPSDRFTEPHPPPPPTLRATSVIVLTPQQVPMIVRGVPSMPRYGVLAPTKVTAKVGPGDIHSTQNTNPVWNPATGSWDSSPGGSGVGDLRWTVWTLPDPGSVDPDTGTYLLGDPASGEVTDAHTHQWAPDPGMPTGPAWHAADPFRPSVLSRDTTTADGKPYKHPAGVSFSSNTNAHMWLDMGTPTKQPFTWVIVAMMLRQTGGLQTILDSGRNPYAVGFPVLTAAQLGDGWTVADNLGYRQQVSTDPPYTILMDTSLAESQASGVGIQGPGSGAGKVNLGGGAVAPRMYGCVFNGSASMFYFRGTDVFTVLNGTVFTGASYLHQYYVLGRQYGIVGPRTGAEMIVFELRFWHRALTRAEMDEQYAQLGSTYGFHKYGQFAS